jgi:hypothetical protein
MNENTASVGTAELRERQGGDAEFIPSPGSGCTLLAVDLCKGMIAGTISDEYSPIRASRAIKGY